MGNLAHVEVEQAVLAAALLDESLADRVASELDAEDFSNLSTRLTWGAVSRLRANKTALDVRTIQADLEQRGEFDRVGGVSYLSDLDTNLPDLSGFDSYLSILRHATARREFVRVAEAAVRKARKGEEETFSIVSELSSSLRGLETRSNGAGHLRPAHFGFGMVRERVDNPAPNGLVGLPSGFPALDKVTLGWQPGLIVLAGRPGAGKTAAAMGFAKAAAEFSIPVSFYSLEMGADELGVRLVSSDTGVEFWRVRSGYLTQGERTNVVRSMEDMKSLPLLIDDTAGMTVEKIAASARKSVRDNGCKLVVVDYLGLISASPGQKAERRDLEIGSYTRQLKILSKELRIPILLLHQLSRRNEQRTDQTPILSDLRDSGNIEQDADIVIFIHKRPEGTRFIVAKHRNGPTATVQVKDNLQFCRFDP